MEFKIVIFIFIFDKGKETLLADREPQRVPGVKIIIPLKVTDYILNLFYISGLCYSVKHNGLRCQ